MMITSQVAGLRAAALRTEAGHVRDAATTLQALAEQAEVRLAPVRARMGPHVWAGAAARVAEHALASAGDDLAVAAAQLREVSHDLRVTAATLEWRASDLLTGAPLLGVDDEQEVR